MRDRPQASTRFEKVTDLGFLFICELGPLGQMKASMMPTYNDAVGQFPKLNTFWLYCFQK